MKYTLTAVLAVSSFAMANAVTMTVHASGATNIYGSPNWATYNSNAIFALENGLNNFGSGAGEYYNAHGETHGVQENIVTGFNSWKGVANPLAPFDQEYGTRWHFGLHILGEGTKFNLDQLTFGLTSDNEPSLNYFGDFLGLSYNDRRVGINYGLDGMKGGGDDVRYESGEAGTTLVDELIYTGVGNAFAVYDNGVDPLQQQIDDAVASLSGYKFTGAYALDLGGGNVVGASAYTNFDAVPEPASMTILGLGVAALLRKKRKS